MLRTNEKLLKQTGEVSLKVRSIHGRKAARLYDHLGAGATELEGAEKEESAAVAANAVARKHANESPKLVEAVVRGVVIIVGVLKRSLSMPEASPFELSDPIAYAEEVAAVLEGRDPILAALAKGLRAVVAEHARLIEVHDATVGRLESAAHHHQAARKALAALVSRAREAIVLATPKEAFGRQHKRKPGGRRAVRGEAKPADTLPQAPAPSNGTPPGAATSVSPAASSKPDVTA